MLLPDVIISTYNEGFSGIYVKCHSPKKASDKFMILFEKAYLQAINALEQDTNAPVREKEENIPCSASVQILDETQFLIKLAPLFLGINDGVRADNEYLTNALIETLRNLEKEYHDITYYGMIAYEWYDEHGGDIVSYEISSGEPIPEDNIYPFVKDIFNTIFADENLSKEFWERFEDNCCDITQEDANNIIQCFKLYLPQNSQEITHAQSILDEYTYED